MSTQVTIIGEQQSEKTKTAIEFKCFLNSVNPNGDHILYPATNERPLPFPHSYNFIELICRDYTTDSDLMFAYNDPNDRSAGRLYIGNFNDGVVE
jgi:hypothetical protein